MQLPVYEWPAPVFISGTQFIDEDQAIRTEGGSPTTFHIGRDLPALDIPAAKIRWFVNALDGRLMNVNWRNGRLCHAIESGNRWNPLVPLRPRDCWWVRSPPRRRWWERGQLPDNRHSFFDRRHRQIRRCRPGHRPCDGTINPNVQVTGREETDPAGTMGVPVVVVEADSMGNRWGDYFDLLVVPSTTRSSTSASGRPQGGWRPDRQLRGDRAGLRWRPNGDNIINVQDPSI